MPPLIAHYVGQGFEMNDENTRLQAYKNLGVQEVNIIIWITEQDEYEEFMSRYGNYAEGHQLAEDNTKCYCTNIAVPKRKISIIPIALSGLLKSPATKIFSL